MRSPGRALVGHQERPATPASAFAAICARQPSLSRSLVLAPRAQSAAVAIGARAPPRPFSPIACTILRFVLPKLRPRSAVAEHASERLVRHGEPRSPLFLLRRGAPPPRAKSACLPASWSRLVSASCSPRHRDAREPRQSRSTGPAPRDGGEQRRRSAMAGGGLAPVRFRPHKRVC